LAPESTLRKNRLYLAIGAIPLAALLLFALASFASSPDPDDEPAAAGQIATPSVSDPVLDIAAPVGIDLSGTVGSEVGDLAPEFAGISTWINSEPLTMEGLRSQVVLVDFWTYTCINCIRTMPFLRDWQNKYADRGLVIVGVHSPEFEFEEIAENVVRAAADFGLEYPIAQDNDFRTWRNFNNRFWPAKYLIDQQGVVRYTHFGEGGYDETERFIRELLEEGGTSVRDIAPNDDPGPVADPRAYSTNFEDQVTRELYGGWERNAAAEGLYIAHAFYYNGPEQTLLYEDPGDHFNQFLFLEGLWFNGLESVKHARATESYEDYIALRFFARSANAVIDIEDGVEPFKVKVTIEDQETGEERALLPEEAGEDIVYEDGESFLVVDEGRLYFVVSLPAFDDRELKFRSNSPDFALFAMVFGAYADIS
jgi:thiol-disulfide isomerase/thioredoxin